MEIRVLDRQTLLKLAPDIEQLHMDAFGTPFAKGYLKWRYLDNPEKKMYAAVALEGNTVAAFHAAIPMDMTYHSIPICGAMTSNAMTHPSFGGRGLFTSVTQCVFEQLQADNRALVFGFSNVHSNHIHCQSLQYSAVYEVPMLELPLDTQASSGSGITFDNAFDLTYSDMFFPERIAVKKDQAYLRWRYAHSPENMYWNIVLSSGNEVRGYAVCKRWQDKLNLVEFHVRSMTDAPELLQCCIDYALGMECRYLTVWAPLNTDIHFFFERKKFINRYPIHYFNAKAFTSLPGNADVLDARSWALQMGDNNTY